MAEERNDEGTTRANSLPTLQPARTPDSYFRPQSLAPNTTFNYPDIPNSPAQPSPVPQPSPRLQQHLTPQPSPEKILTEERGCQAVPAVSSRSIGTTERTYQSRFTATTPLPEIRRPTVKERGTMTSAEKSRPPEPAPQTAPELPPSSMVLELQPYVIHPRYHRENSRDLEANGRHGDTNAAGRERWESGHWDFIPTGDGLLLAVNQMSGETRRVDGERDQPHLVSLNKLERKLLQEWQQTAEVPQNTRRGNSYQPHQQYQHGSHQQLDPRYANHKKRQRKNTTHPRPNARG